MKKLPVLFIGHGSPMNAIEDNKFTRNWKFIADKIPKPKAILCISAHWQIEGSAVTAMEKPRTIHDFYGFPNELYKINYPVKGSKKYSELIKNIIKNVKIGLDNEWGLDHGTWSVLNNMYPKADIPVIQLSLDYNLNPKQIFEIGKELNKLRDKEILIIGSGNIVHNLMMINPNDKAYPWAIEFDEFVKISIEKKDYNSLINYEKHRFSKLAHPTNDHYLPLLYVLGVVENEKPYFFNEEIFWGSVSMRCVAWGL